MTVLEILRELYPGKENQIDFLEITYKKKPLPTINPKINHKSSTFK